MNKNSPNTEEILDAIKNMMSEKSAHHNDELPKDIIELTNPIDEVVKKDDEKVDILELSNPINVEKIKNIEDDKAKLDTSIDDTVNEEQIKQAVRDAVASLPQSKLDQIINEELTKIIQERINSSKIIISTENKKN
tara:strand:- start:5464 stop:5871 length:408 start_codon:yes stop_codon:yes gene_type:complete